MASTPAHNLLKTAVRIFSGKKQSSCLIQVPVADVLSKVAEIVYNYTAVSSVNQLEKYLTVSIT